MSTETLLPLESKWKVGTLVRTNKITSLVRPPTYLVIGASDTHYWLLENLNDSWAELSVKITKQLCHEVLEPIPHTSTEGLG